MAVAYLNPTTNKSEVAFLALLSEESKPVVEFALKSFMKMCFRMDLIFMVDKDFGSLVPFIYNPTLYLSRDKIYENVSSNCTCQ